MNGEIGPELISNNIGVGVLCKNCDRYEICDHSYSRIPPVNDLIMRYNNEHNRGFNSYPWPGDWSMQPEWFMSLLNHCRSEQNRLEKEKIKQEQKKRK